MVGVCPLRVERWTVSPGDWPESQLVSYPDCISIEQTISYQTSQWRERSLPLQCWRKGKRKRMNRSQVTVAQRQFTTDVFKEKSQERVIDKNVHEDQPVIDIIIEHWFNILEYCVLWVEIWHPDIAGLPCIIDKRTSQSPQTVNKVHSNLGGQKSVCHWWVPLIWILFFFFFFLIRVINTAVVSVNETRAEPPTNCSCQCQPA